MIGIVISEKGGAERRERYDQNEITIGRVKGNDVLLPKGNVSKRHARLILRDGRYIVTDLKSTNGTYVNHRRITHATLVREGDRIYIGDFVIRIESDEASDVELRDSSSDRVYSSPSDPQPTKDSVGPQHGVVSHFPIEHDPDESSPSLDVPAPPPVPSGLRTGTGSHPAVSSADPPMTSEAPSPRGSNPSSLSITSQPMPPVRVAMELEESHLAKQQQHDELVATVTAELGVERLAVVSPDETLRAEAEAKVDAAVVELELASGAEATEVKQAVLAELLELGPLTGIVDDENISRIEVGPGCFRTYRRGRPLPPGAMAFADDHGIARALMRLAHHAGHDLDDDEGLVVFALDEQRRVHCARPPLSHGGHVMTVDRQGRREVSLDQLVRDGAISRGMATLLKHCITARANILLVGSPDGGVDDMLEALTSSGVPGRSLWLVPEGFPPPTRAPALRLEGGTDARAHVVEAATELAPDHLVAPAPEGPVLTSLLGAIGRGTSGVIMTASSATLRQAMTRLAAEVSMARGGLPIATCREWLSSSFDLGLEVTRVRDGRMRVVRLVEFRASTQGVSLRDIFSFAYHGTAAGGSVEGAFYASGTVPRLVEDLAARGLVLDTSIFRRHPIA